MNRLDRASRSIIFPDGAKMVAVEFGGRVVVQCGYDVDGMFVHGTDALDVETFDAMTDEQLANYYRLTCASLFADVQAFRAEMGDG